MGRTFVNGTIFGSFDTRQYSFFVDTGAAMMGLPMEEIEALGLETVIDGKRVFLTANGRVELDTYLIRGNIRGRGFAAMVAPSPVPLVGYEMLQDMRLKVNPVTEELEEVLEEDLGPPYMLIAVRQDANTLFL
jgi:predicted aspartyl protease